MAHDRTAPHFTSDGSHCKIKGDGVRKKDTADFFGATKVDMPEVQRRDVSRRKRIREGLTDGK